MEEEKLRRVKLHSMLSVVSSTPIEPGKVHKFSLWDQAMGPQTIHVVFYYGSNPFANGPMASDLDNLRISLSHVLDEYPIVTGRLTRGPDGGWRVMCNDAGVRMLQASVNATLDEWLRSADACEERDLTVWEDMPEDPSYWSPFRIQINNFKCGGLAIGLSCTHMHADITSVTQLIKSWAEVHCGLPLTHPPIFNLPTHMTSPHHQNNSIPSFSTPIHSPNNITPPKMATVTMKFSASIIKNRLTQVQTPFDFLAALFWSRIAQSQHQSPSNGQKRSLSICIDSRNHGPNPIPYGYFGNAMCVSVLNVDDNNLLSGGLGQVCDYIHRHVEGLKGEDNFMPSLSSKEGDGPFRVYGPGLTCISMEHMVIEKGEGLMYSAVFNNGGRPIHVSYHYGNVEGEGLIIVMPSGEGGPGRAVTVTLLEEQIDKLCKDQEILDLEPVMVISGR